MEYGNKIIDGKEYSFREEGIFVKDMEARSYLKVTSITSKLTDALISAKEDRVQHDINSKSLAYLSSTDWYITRLTETGIAVPQDILNTRTEARLKIV